MLTAPFDSAPEKNVHDSSPTYENSGYGTPPVSTSATRLKKTVNTTIITNGVTSAHAKPTPGLLVPRRELALGQHDDELAPAPQLAQHHDRAHGARKISSCGGPSSAFTSAPARPTPPATAGPEPRS